MRRHKRLPVPQHEFGFTQQAFNLILDNALDGWRVTYEREASEEARRQAEAAQPPISFLTNAKQ